ncbi:serine phosphatase, SpoIIE domain-containing [Desulfuromonas sp. DDH964]|uniref:PP2C family protein-serine/threonine phosphatase n=1 Tax=Desulfuromonas sp. DDH964 TaxID=1823759 RepID=UPI00078E4214|nr:PP2C family protein-serine/threonine phosphatase [Desulfuromonas sp. DDH964]AMV70683.1 serine phosphatase, SpoIIE domain-containing [Desulfuromonas sp. DDH964]
MEIPDQLEIDLASHVQKLLFPKSSPVCDWSCIGVKNRMAKGLGGDYFDFIALPDGCQALFIGDVTGHGLPAAVVMSLLYGYINRFAAEICSPLDVVRGVNGFLQSFAIRSPEFDHHFSSTLFLGFIHPDTLAMEYVNAGHPAPLILRGRNLHTLPPTAPPIGFFDAPEIHMETFQFAQEDRLLLYTDGVIEAPDQAEELFGLERLQDVLLQTRGDHMEFLEQLFAALKEFTGRDTPRDDCTAIVIDFHRGWPTPQGK